jgi:hypothetical protein
VKKEFANEKVDTQDGIRIDWPNAWVHARPSNTEPIMRIIAEAPDRATAQARARAVQKVVDAALECALNSAASRSVPRATAQPRLVTRDNSIGRLHVVAADAA